MVFSSSPPSLMERGWFRQKPCRAVQRAQPQRQQQRHPVQWSSQVDRPSSGPSEAVITRQYLTLPVKVPVPLSSLPSQGKATNSLKPSTCVWGIPGNGNQPWQKICNHLEDKVFRILIWQKLGYVSLYPLHAQYIPWNLACHLVLFNELYHSTQMPTVQA